MELPYFFSPILMLKCPKPLLAYYLDSFCVGRNVFNRPLYIPRFCTDPS